MRRRSILELAAALPLSQVALAPLFAGCTDKGKLAEEAASEAVDIALPLLTRDTDQVRKGLPLGAKVLAKRMPADPVGNRLELEHAIKASRENVDSLINAKSTFFSFADPKGIVLRSEVESDELSEKNILQTYPDLAKALDPKSGLVESYGEHPALRGVRNGPDTAWIVACPVLGPEDKVLGLFLSGWSMRLYARVLQDGAASKLDEKSKGKSEAIHMLVFILKGKGAFGHPDAPDEHVTELVNLDIVPKVQSGVFTTRKDLEGRSWGIVAKKAPQLGEDAALAGVATIY